MARLLRALMVAAMGALLIGGCERANGAGATPEAPVMVVDTIHPPEISLARFREGLAPPAESLPGGESSIETLTARWVAAVESHDTATIRRLVLDRAEFAWLYYPASAYSRRPLYQPPELVWFRLQAGSEKGIVRVLRRLGGTDMGYRSVACPAPPRLEGTNRIWEYCEVRRAEAGEVRSAMLFGGILERAGRFKFISYANQY